MKELYLIAGISKQAVWKQGKREEKQALIRQEVIRSIDRVRKRHKRMSCRKIYKMTKNEVPVGRDIFEQIGFANGYKIKLKRNPMKTTWSQRVEVFPNLIEGQKVNNINQVWQSDIFYLPVEGKHYYGITIQDVYSRRLLALHLSRSMKAEENVKALTKALALRHYRVQGCIFHSDRGSQYISEPQKRLLKENHMKISMCLLPQENAYIERVQGTLKHEYFFAQPLNSKNIHQWAAKTIRYYNDERPHKELDMLTPSQFEDKISNGIKGPSMRIFKWKHTKNKEQLVNLKTE